MPPAESRGPPSTSQRSPLDAKSSLIYPISKKLSIFWLTQKSCRPRIRHGHYWVWGLSFVVTDDLADDLKEKDGMVHITGEPREGEPTNLVLRTFSRSILQRNLKSVAN